MFMSVKRGYVDVDETNIRILKRGLGSGGEVAQAGTDRNHQISLAGDDVRARRAGHADGVEVLRMIEGQRPLARLRLSYRNACLLDEASQSRGSFGVDHSASGDNHWSIRGANPLRRALEQRAIGRRSRDMPHTLVKEFLGIVPRFGLNVLRQS